MNSKIFCEKWSTGNLQIWPVIFRQSYPNCTWSGTYNTQELPCSIRWLPTHNRWKWLEISHPVADHKVGIVPEALKGQGLCDQSPRHLIILWSASCMPHQLLQWMWLTTDQWQNSPALNIQRSWVAGETNGRTMGMVYICQIWISSKQLRHSCSLS